MQSSHGASLRWVLWPDPTSLFTKACGRSKPPWLPPPGQPLTNPRRWRRYKWPSGIFSLEMPAQEKTGGPVALSQVQWEQLLRFWHCPNWNQSPWPLPCCSDPHDQSGPVVLKCWCKSSWSSRAFWGLWLSWAASWPPDGTQAMLLSNTAASSRLASKPGLLFGGLCLPFGDCSYGQTTWSNGYAVQLGPIAMWREECEWIS